MGRPQGGSRAGSRRQARARWALACADRRGGFWDEPGLEAAVRLGTALRTPHEDELSPVPPGSVVQFLPGRIPLAWPVGSPRSLPPLEVEGALALAVQLPSGWTRTLLPAWRRTPDAPDLPIFGYAAAVFRGDRLYCAALQTEANPRWDPRRYGTPDLPARIRERRKRSPENRVLRQLEVCALEYGCYNAQNMFYGRWEGAVPVSPACNAFCRGCISLQPEGLPPSPQVRLDFVPTLKEIVEVGLEHLAHPDALFTFGQGCEGEPLLQAPRIAESIREIRARTPRGTLHLNTNGSRPRGVRQVVEAGLDSMRVSLNSTVPERYTAYYQPKGYGFADLEESIRIARGHGVWVSLNLLMMPGVNDAEEEVESLLDFVRRLDVNMIQTRNLNMDPDLFFATVPEPRSPALGVPEMLRRLRAGAPQVRVGNHNPQRGADGSWP